VTLSIFDAVAETPSRTALVHERGLLTYTSLAARVRRRIEELDARGLGDATGTRPVALVATPSIATVEWLFALFAAGTPALVLHPRSTPAERAALRERAAAVDIDAPEGSFVPLAAPGRGSFDPERIAVILATAGSSGVPKLVRLSHRALVAAARASEAHLGSEERDRWLACLPFSHVGGLSVLTRMLVSRRTSVLFEPAGSLLGDLPSLVRCLHEQRVTLLSVVPAILDRLLRTSFVPPEALRAVLTGGASLGARLLERAGERHIPVLPTYGLTEASAQVTTRRYELRGRPAGPGAVLAPSGVPLSSVEVRIVEGQIELRGPALFSGYLGDTEARAPGTWFRTRDRGLFSDGGELVVTGRSDDTIVTGGENVDPAEVEAALTTLPGVNAACVFGIPDEAFGEMVAALVEGQKSTSHDQLERALGEKIARYKLPRRIAWVNELPLLHSNKVDRGRAKAIFLRASP
jgi:O-succinylbenzoic acid--CoA ligase